MPFEHPSGLPHSYLRDALHPERQSVVFYGKRSFVQGAELNDLQEIARGRHDRLGRLIAKDGDRVEGATALVDRDAATVTLHAGSIYVSGDVFPVAERTLTAVSMTGTAHLGVRLTRSWLTHENAPELVGLVEGTAAEGEPGAAREVAVIEWVNVDAARAALLPGQTLAGEYYTVYTLKDGTILDQTPPPLLDGVRQALAAYDRPHGHYIVDGCRVTALGINGGKQIFSIEQGEANISGFKITRYAALRHEEIEDWDEAAAAGETHTYTGGASNVVTLDNGPVAQILSILLTKEKTINVTRGAVIGGSDLLADTSVTSVIEVKQGATIYADPASYVRTGNSIDWSGAGPEPAPGSSYSVKYRYRASVLPTAQTSSSVTASGGAAGGDVLVSYTFKLPRIDMLCLNQNGEPVYVKGVPARADPLPPVPPRDVLPLCQLRQNWLTSPEVLNDGVRFIPVWEQWKYFNRVFDHERLIQLERLKSGIDRREPVAKKGTFVDPFEDDSYRDLGMAQTASVGDGVMQLAIQPTFYLATLTAPVTLAYVEEIVASQLLKTACAKINPYANFNPLPGAMTITPAADFWVDNSTVWASPATVEFNTGTRTVRATSATLDQGQVTRSSSVSSSSSVTDAQVDFRSQQASFLRQIPVSYVISGFGPGEILAALFFGDVDVRGGASPAADAGGHIAGTFNIPANIPAGTAIIYARGAGGTEARAMFTGQGLISITTMRRTTTITRSQVDVVTTGTAVNTPLVPAVPRRPVIRITSSGGDRGNADPQAQLFALGENRQLVGADFHLCALGAAGNHIMLDQVSVDNGYPTSEVEAEAFIDMTGAAIGWKSGRYSLPFFTSTESYHAFVIKTDDNVHSISLAALGGFDAELQQWVSVHPYATGPRFSSVNAQTWTAHQGEALTFRLVAAKYTQLTRTVHLGTFNLVDASDLQVRAVTELPSPDCDIVFEIERPGGIIYRMRSHQVVRLAEYVTETVILRAILTGTEKLSPILYAPVALIAGKIAASGTYVTRAFNLGVNMVLTSYIKAHLPASSTLVVEYDKSDGNWIALPLINTEVLTDPRWVERKHSASAITGVTGRLRLTLNGGPAARAELCDFGAALM
jgi:Domain of unknown function (DUF4815)